MRLPARLARLFKGPFLRYVVTGVITVAVDIGMLVLLREAFHVEVFLAATISFWLSIVFNFCLNKYWTFGVALGTPQQIATYLVLICCNYLAGLIVIDAAIALHASYILGKSAALVLTTAWNYLLYKRVVFIEQSLLAMPFKRLSRKLRTRAVPQ